MKPLTLVTQDGASMTEARAEAWRSYFPIFREIDLPLKNRFPNPQFWASRDIMLEQVENWTLLRDRYLAIDTNQLDANSGKETIEKIKPLMREFDTAFARYVKQCEHITSDDFPEIPSDVTEIKAQIMASADTFGGLPAYIAYRAFDVIDGTELRGFQYRREDL